MAKKNRSIELGRTLKELRKANGLSQQQVADAVNIERSKYAYYEKETRPEYEILKKLACLYGKTVDEILKSEDDETDNISSPPPTYETSWNGDDKLVELSSFEKAVLLKVRLMNFKEKQELKEFLEKSSL